MRTKVRKGTACRGICALLKICCSRNGSNGSLQDTRDDGRLEEPRRRNRGAVKHAAVHVKSQETHDCYRFSYCHYGTAKVQLKLGEGVLSPVLGTCFTSLAAHHRLAF